MAQTAYGSVAKPVSLDHFQRIVGVGWAAGDGVVVVEAEFLQGVQFVFVNVLSPPNIFVGTISGTEILFADYRDNPNWYAMKVGEQFVIQENIKWEDELNDIWVWDALLVNTLGDNTGVEEGNNLYGQFKLHFEGMQVAYDTEHFGRPLLGDYIIYTHPNGHKVTYANGATPLGLAYLGWHSPFGGGDTTGIVIRTSDPNGFLGPENLSNTESWYWYHLRHAPGSEVNKIRQSWLIYFNKDRTHSAELYQAAIAFPEITYYNIRGYPVGTDFNIHEGYITPKDGRPALWEILESVPAGYDGTIKKFGPRGVTA